MILGGGSFVTGTTAAGPRTRPADGSAADVGAAADSDIAFSCVKEVVPNEPTGTGRTTVENAYGIIQLPSSAQCTATMLQPAGR